MNFKNMQNSITFLMSNEHKVIFAKFNKILDGSVVDKKEMLELIKSFKDDLLAHMKLEEQAIFNIEDIGSNEMKQIFVKLLEEHSQIRRMLVDFARLDEETVDDLKDILAKHEALEAGTLYPKLDRELSDDLKEEILKKLSEGSVYGV